MTRRVYFYFVATFLLGVIVGGLGVFFCVSHWGYWRRGPDREGLVRQLTRELDLSEAQVQQLNLIVDETRKKFAELRKQVSPQFEVVREEGNDRIRAILTPEQLEKFNELVRRAERRSRRREPPR